MPIYNLPLEEIDESIIRPVCLGITQDVLHRMDLPKDFPILFKGDAAQQVYRGSETGLTDYTKAQNVRFEADALLYLELAIEDNENTILSTSVDRIEERPVFSDQALAVHMYPTMVSKKVDLQFTLTGTEKQVERWRATLRRKVAQGVTEMVHMVNYHYPIPLTFMYLLVDIYNKRQAVDPYPNTDLKSWLTTHFKKPFSIMSNIAGKGLIYEVKEHQLPITGWFEFGFNPPKPEKDNETSRYSIQFTYSFYFDCPETMTFRTPLVIHNQMLPPHFLDIRRPFEVDLVKYQGSMTQDALEMFRFTAEKLRIPPLPPRGLPIPWYDDWLEYRAPRFYIPLVKILIQVDPNDPTLLVDLKDLGDVALDPLLIDYMSRSATQLNKPYNAAINISQWRWGNLVSMEDLIIGEDLVVRTKNPLNLRDLHHLVISLAYDPTSLTDTGVETLLENVCFAKYYLSTLNGVFQDLYEWDIDRCIIDVKSGDYPKWSWSDYQHVIENAEQYQNSPIFTYPVDRVFWHLVAAYTVVTHSKE